MKIKEKIACPYCESNLVVHNGKANGVPHYKCKRCKHNFPTQKHENGNAFHNPNTKKGAIVAYLSGQDLKKYSERCGIQRTLIYYWVKQFKKRIFYKEGVQDNIKMMDKQQSEYKDLSKRKIRRLRDLYEEKISKASSTYKYRRMLEFLAKNYDLLPTKPDRVSKEELERILNQDLNSTDHFLGGIQGLYFPLKRTQN